MEALQGRVIGLECDDITTCICATGDRVCSFLRRIALRDGQAQTNSIFPDGLRSEVSLGRHGLEWGKAGRFDHALRVLGFRRHYSLSVELTMPLIQ